ncbi:MAG: MmgE/PrpD family protein [Desulfovermiculus sp.]|nr:MmgE/PrpD family protein [Desulfovermiculus sp.]
MSISNEIAQCITETNLNNIPLEVRKKAKLLLIDWLGVTLAGARSELGPVVLGYLNECGQRGPATLLGYDIKYDILSASFGNGVFSHALDFDDYDMETVLHTTAPTLPALLAAAEYTGTGGKKILMAIILALDITLRLGKGVKRVHYNRGWHITSTIGRLGAVAGVSKIMDLSNEVSVNALGIAATSSGGLRNVFGTMSKPFHAGKAAMDGLMACFLARNGMDSDANIFEGKHGFFDLFTESPDKDVILNSLGKEFFLHQISFKTYPAPL